MNHALDEIPAAVSRLAELRDRAGRGGRVEITMSADVSAASDVDRCAELGVDRIFVKPWERTSGAIEGIRRFAAQHLADTEPLPD
jgi:hypothetical protein